MSTFMVVLSLHLLSIFIHLYIVNFIPLLQNAIHFKYGRSIFWIWSEHMPNEILHFIINLNIIFRKEILRFNDS